MHFNFFFSFPSCPTSLRFLLFNRSLLTFHPAPTRAGDVVQSQKGMPKATSSSVTCSAQLSFCNRDELLSVSLIFASQALAIRIDQPLVSVYMR